MNQISPKKWHMHFVMHGAALTLLSHMDVKALDVCIECVAFALVWLY